MRVAGNKKQMWKKIKSQGKCHQLSDLDLEIIRVEEFETHTGGNEYSPCYSFPFIKAPRRTEHAVDT